MARWFTVLHEDISKHARFHADESQSGEMVKRKEYELNVLAPLFVVLTLVAVVNTLQAYYVFFNGDRSFSNFMRFLTSNTIYCWYFLIPALIVRWLSRRISLRRELLFGWVLVHLTTLFLSLVVHQIISLEVDTALLLRNGATLFGALLNNPSVWEDVVVYVLYVLGFYMIEYKRIGRGNEIRQMQLEIKISKARLLELKGKVHPQFLFSTLETITELVRKKKNREADKALSLLGDFLRASVYNREQEEITLGEEIHLLNQYLAIKKIKRKIKITENIDAELMNTWVPNFILQPIVEHLITRNEDSNDIMLGIGVSASRENDELTIAVNTENATSDNASEGAGDIETIMDVTKRRLNQLYAHRCEVRHEVNGENKEFIVVRIPFRNSLYDKKISIVEQKR
ncbi:MAG TPA: histidine kinase [Candidatus Acidoferrales bacterium]|nr:histidine kinase [Candidatus Acidoferrales bacterium]